MNKTITIVIAVLVVGVGAYYLFKNNSGGPAQTLVPEAATPSTPAASAAVSIENFAFSPASLTIKAGETVTWTNNDSVAHTITSDTGNQLNSPTIEPGQSFSFTFKDAGTAAYHCAFHPSMKGSITVEL